jgi:hypothetical protein
MHSSTIFLTREGSVEDLDCAHDPWGVLEMPLPLKAQVLTELKADVTEIW